LPVADLHLDAIETHASVHELLMPGDLRQLVQDFDVADPEGDAFWYAADSSVHKSCCVDRTNSGAD
jgi:hypothetical protein